MTADLVGTMHVPISLAELVKAGRETVGRLLGKGVVYTGPVEQVDAIVSPVRTCAGVVAATALALAAAARGGGVRT